MGELTVVDLHATRSPDDHLEMARSWARYTWSAWQGVHGLVKEQAEKYLGA